VDYRLFSIIFDGKRKTSFQAAFRIVSASQYKALRDMHTILSVKMR